MYKKSLSWFFSCISRDSRNCGECENGNNCYEAKLQIQGLIESSGEKRTLSRGALDQIWNGIKQRGQYAFIVCLQELGYTIEEPKGKEEKP